MRLFVAFELPERVRQAIESWVAAQRPHLPRAQWVTTRNLHLTLSFLGDTDPGQLPAIEEALDAAFAEAPPLAMRLTEVGGFPKGGAARVVWVGVDADPDLAGIQAQVASAVRTALPAAQLDGRAWKPHITLARCAPPWPLASVGRLQVAGRALPSLPFRIAEGVLFASELQPTGAVHTQVAVFPLRGGA